MKFALLPVLTIAILVASCNEPRKATSCPGPRNRPPKQFSLKNPTSTLEKVTYIVSR